MGGVAHCYLSHSLEHSAPHQEERCGIIVRTVPRKFAQKQHGVFATQRCHFQRQRQQLKGVSVLEPFEFHNLAQILNEECDEARVGSTI